MMQITPIPSSPTTVSPIKGPSIHKKKEPKPEVSAAQEEARTVDGEGQVLGALRDKDRLVITKRLQVKNTVFLRGKRNRFYVRTPDQSLVYTVEEKTKWWVGYLCYGLRPLQLHVSNSAGTEVMTIVRPYACTSRVLPCQMQTLTVYSPPGTCIGRVQQHWSALKPLYLVLNQAGDPLFWVRGPRMTICFFRDVQFEIQRSADGAPIGKTFKRWRGVFHALFYAPLLDRFALTFDKTLECQEKALLLATSILMDYMYYDA